MVNENSVSSDSFLPMDSVKIFIDAFERFLALNYSVQKVESKCMRG